MFWEILQTPVVPSKQQKTEVAALPSTDYLNTSSVRGKAQRSAPGHKSRPQAPPPEGGVGGDITGEKPIHVGASHDVKSQVWAVLRHKDVHACTRPHTQVCLSHCYHPMHEKTHTENLDLHPHLTDAHTQ